MKTLTALSITPAARDWLARTTAARVLSAFDRTCNLIAGDGAVLALSTPDAGRTPFSLTVAPAGPAPFRHLTAGAPVRVGDGTLALDGLRVCVAVAPARPWDPVPDWESVRRALVGAEALARGLRSGAGEALREGARLLAGVGGGLTPAGDDFIVGAMLAAWAGLAGPGAESRCPAIVEAAAPLTTALSAAFLRAAARGECSEQWHTLFESLAVGQIGDWRLEIGDWTPCVEIGGVLAVGHTSGADALAGLLWVYNGGRPTARRGERKNSEELLWREATIS
ncbi:MAG: DUF2877 domain-containing protein [Chloroflexi bacterium]|nr:DUF2877 domain-containing protein [Chloroflexota bacterium]